MFKKPFPIYLQLESMDCGPSCLRIIAKYYGKVYSVQYLREKAYITREGVSLLGISDAAEAIGFKTLSVQIPFDRLDEMPLPCIAHWNQRHFIVIYDIDKKGNIHVADPAHGLTVFTPEEFKKGWCSIGDQGVLLLLETTPIFYQTEDERKSKEGLNIRFFAQYLRPYRRFIVQLFIGMLVGSLLQLAAPFLTQSLVDFGINTHNLNFVYLILIAQVTLFISQTAVEFIRSWILLHLGTRINISIVSDFLIKLMKLPLPFFDTKMIGDILQRISDNSRIESFLTGTALNTLFSLVNLVIFGVVLLVYSVPILIIYFSATLLSTLWVFLFLKKREEFDYKRFSLSSGNQSQLIQLITGMQEIKLNGAEKMKRWEWERNQARIFNMSVKSLALGQYQTAGNSFINQFKNILISIYSAKAVIDGDMTLGMMMAVQSIIGQLNAPVGQLIGFIQSAQDAKLSLERLQEIHGKENEENPDDDKVTIFPEDRTITLENVSFQYEGPHSEPVLKDLSMVIPEGKVTAIVGTSGSGKTTLLKLLLKFYPPVTGKINVSSIDLENFSAKVWRQQCGVVMQDGFIFSDTIANNIAFGFERVEKERLLHAVHVANIQDFIESLPLGYNTKIGSDGHGLSQGQRQRILIARAVYKNPTYLFFDEATSALDANNEMVIMRNLQEFFEGRTVVVIAHRLSTVKKADQIVTLEKGRIIEHGTHRELTDLRGAYYHLVKNQLELGN
ncbi:MAG: peptidase domain-containing ABC transporter [Candidatus Kapabacteria bacterium]|nr:peptidase domain-containing ABC transporter [Candidatus Kapabacteria bacterium]